MQIAERVLSKLPSSLMPETQTQQLRETKISANQSEDNAMILPSEEEGGEKLDEKTSNDDREEDLV